MSAWFCILPFAGYLSAACTAAPPLAAGYVEGEYDLIAPVAVAQIAQVDVARGAHVKAGAVLVRMDQSDARLVLAKAGAALAQALSKLADLRQGRRPEEIAVLRAALASAEARASDARKALERQSNLNAKGVAAQSALDSARTRVQVEEAAVAQARANLDVARLPARPDQIAAAEAAVRQARAARDQAAWQLSQRILKAPAAGTVHDILRHPGEIAGPQSAVVSFLPDKAVKLQLFVPETALASIRPGMRLSVRCDGCGSGETATVSYVADSPEFTPPVIYSLQSRQKLSYLVEARPDPGSSRLKPGQIVDAVLPEPKR